MDLAVGGPPVQVFWAENLTVLETGLEVIVLEGNELIAFDVQCGPDGVARVLTFVTTTAIVGVELDRFHHVPPTVALIFSDPLWLKIGEGVRGKSLALISLIITMLILF